jgi:hypothetical protein
MLAIFIICSVAPFRPKVVGSDFGQVRLGYPNLLDLEGTGPCGKHGDG